MLHLIEKSGGAIGIKLLYNPMGGLSMETVFSLKDHGEIIISNTPTVSTDFFTLRVLNTGSIDFDYVTKDFIISRTPNVVPA